MKREKIDLSPERQLVTHLIVSDRFITRMSTILRPSLLRTEYARQAATWALEYFQHYKQAPGKNIQDIFRRKKAEIRDEEEQASLSDFLSHLSEEYESSVPTNLEHAIDEAVRYLKLRSLDVLREDVGAALDAGDPLKAEQYVANYSRVEPSSSSAVSMLKDSGSITAALMEEEERLFKFPGALGQLAGWFLRGDFISYLGPMKRGKTHWMWYTAEVAAHNNLRCAYFTLEMTRNGMIRRGWRSLTGTARESELVRIPYFEKNADDRWAVKIREEQRAAADPKEVRERQNKLRHLFRGGDIEVIAVPAYSATTEDIEAHLDTLDHYNRFVPDVVIVDYADIVAPLRRNGEYRHQLDEIWKGLRRMAQERNCLVVTASQSDKSTLSQDVSGEHISEDIRKLAHVTAMLGLNQTDAEYDVGVMRVSQTAIREGRKMTGQIVALQCLSIGRPYLDGHWAKEVDLDLDDDDGKPRKNAQRRRR